MVKSICGIREGYSKKIKLGTEITFLDARVRGKEAGK